MLLAHGGEKTLMRAHLIFVLSVMVCLTIGFAATPAFAQDSGGCTSGECCGGACSCGTFCGCGGGETGDSEPPAGLPLSSFSTNGLHLHSNLTLQEMGVTGTGVLGNDIWGWTDSLTGKRYAIFGLTNGTTFVDVTNRNAPVYLGTLPTQTGNAVWRDIKVHQNHAYIVSDGNGAHGMQVFDLTRLRTVTVPQTFTNDGHYTGVTNTHNLAINNATGRAYLVGSNTHSGGLHIVDLSNPTVPVFVNGYSTDAYIHDTEVVIYNGPDTAHVGKEIAFNSSVNDVTITDVTNAHLGTPVRLGQGTYTGSQYIHQGSLTADHRYFLQNDELDDDDNGTTRTHIWDVQDLDNPFYVGYHDLGTNSIDHNLYVVGNLVYEANYTTGLRVLELTDLANADLTEIAFLDTHPEKDSNTSFDGAWSVYPYFDDGTIIVSDRQRGLFVVSLPEPSSAVLLGGSLMLLLSRRRFQ